MNNLKFVQLQFLGALLMMALNANAQTCAPVSANEPWTWPGHNNWFFASGNGWTGQTYKWVPAWPGAIAPAITTQGAVGTNAVTTYEGTATASDDNGNLVMFSNGRRLWDAAGTLKYSGLLTGNEGGMTGNNGSACQGVVIVRHPLNPTIYYVFTTDDANQGATVGFNYYSFDQNGNLLTGPTRLGTYRTMEGVAATRHANGVDVWITSYESGTNNFNTYLLTCTGLNTTPVVSAVAPMINNSNEERGGVAFSWDSKRFAQVHPNSTGGESDKEVSVYDFDNATGAITNPLHISSLLANELPYDLTFSPDNSKLYYSTATGQVGYYDLSSGVAATILLTQTFLTIPAASTHAALEIGPDGKLYQASGDTGLPLRQIDGNLNVGGGGAFTVNNIVGTETSKGLPSMYIAPQDYISIPAAGPICNTSGSNLNLSANWLCAGTNAEDPVGNPTGWSGTGITNAATGIFDPTGLAAGPYVITYTYNAACATVTGTVTITVTTCAPCGDTTLAASIPNICTGAGTFDLDLYKGTSAAGTWSIVNGPSLYAATVAGDGHTFILNNTSGGTYTVRHTLNVVGGGCPAFSERTFTIYPPSAGGTISSDASVCTGNNSGTLTLSGHTGTVVGWESSTDNFGTSTPIVNTTTSQTYNNLVVTTYYIAIVQSGTCASATSAVVTITVDPTPVGGAVTSDATVCSGSNGANLTLAGHTGTIADWETSPDGNIWTSTGSTSNPYAYSNITSTTHYRAVVKSGACATANSIAAIITVNPVTIGGTVNANDTVCSGSNGANLTLTGQTGTITDWETSPDGISWTSTGLSANPYTYSNIVSTTHYRAVVKSGVCVSENSAEAIITVDPVSVGGTVNSDAAVCSGSNGANLTLVGHTGTIQDWETSPDGISWSSAGSTTNPYPYSNLTSTTHYRAVVKSGVCNSSNSAEATITVNPLPTPSVADATICVGDPAAVFDAGVYASYVWSANGSGTLQTTTGTTAGDYIVEVTDGNGCKAIDTATLTVNNLPIVALGDTSVCPGGAITLSTSPAGWISYEWNSNPLLNTPTLSYNQPGTVVTVRVEDANGCFNTASANIALGDTLHVDFGGDKQICSYESLTLNAAQYGPFTAPVVYTWDGVNGTATKTVNQSGSYGVSVMDGRGCMGSDTVQLTVNPVTEVTLGNDTTVCFTGKEQWVGFVPDIYSSVLWSTGSSDTTAFTQAIGSVWVSVTNQFNCADADTVFVGEFCVPTPLCFPDVITPNADGDNDVFLPCINDYQPIDNGNYKGIIDNIVWVDFVVYDRWGIKMFQSKDIIPRWDGTYQGVAVSTGTYYYIVRYSDSSKANYEQTGYITVINKQ
ncbi:MAG: gliding motility-associated C-terminal domain-containing protein [Flavobacteriales bacterium]